ncbi:flavodoxin domain-containing protein [Agromyces soli]
MRALVVYESMFGNTAACAEAIAAVLGRRAEVRLAHADEGARLDGLDLVVVGSPTHGFALPSGLSRRAARAQGADASAAGRRGVREWLGALEPFATTETRTAVAEPPFAAAFDVRQAPGTAGAPAHRVLHRLEKLGLRRFADPVSFRVGPTAGPLLAGELDRAAAWAEGIARLPPVE